ncbi:MAG: glycoside hydrolase family 25 protein [Actinobacteria bacterium]|nr:glycoside hydrolase family 25 protein [Actinomycetota bacterium]MBI3687226.1 glycoside hydrolase family 25 protein [Actinomycetota bacterium]
MTTWADVSHWQMIDLRAYAAAGHDRIACKATEGSGYVDPTFAYRWRLAGQLGLARLAYHFATAANRGADDFDHFIGTVHAAGGVGPRDLLCLDSEDPAGVSRADDHAREFTARAVARGYPSGCLYTGRWYANPANLQPDDLAPGWRRLWISDYGPAPDGQIPLPDGWTRNQVIARQYTSTATLPGITGPADANRTLIDWLGKDPIMALDQQYFDRKFADVQNGLALIIWGDDRDDTKDIGTHPDNIQRVRKDLADLAAKVGGLAASGGTVDVDALAEAVADKLAARMAQ